MTSETKNTSIVSDFIRKAVENNASDILRIALSEFKPFIDPSSSDLALTCLIMIRNNHFDTISTWIDSGLPLSHLGTALEDSELNCFKLLFNAAPSEFQSDYPYLNYREVNAAAFALHNGNADIAEFLIERGIQLSKDDYSLSDLIWDLNQKKARKTMTALNHITYTEEDFASLSDHSKNKLYSNLIAVEDKALLKRLSENEIFSEHMTCQCIIDMAFLTGSAIFIEFLLSSGINAKPQSDTTIAEEVLSESRSFSKGYDLTKLFVGFPQALKRYIESDIFKQSKEHTTPSTLLSSLGIAFQQGCTESIELLINHTQLHSFIFTDNEENSTTRKELLISSLITNLNPKVSFNSVFKYLPTTFVDEAAGLIPAALGHSKTWSNSDIPEAPRLIDFFDFLESMEVSIPDKVVQGVAKQIINVQTSCNFWTADTSSDDSTERLFALTMKLVGDLTERFGQVFSDAMMINSEFLGNSVKQILAVIRRETNSHSGRIKRNRAVLILASATPDEKVQYLDAMASKTELQDDSAFSFAVHLWDLKVVEVMTWKLKKSTQKALLASLR